MTAEGETATPTNEALTRVHLNLLETIKSCQQQNGLRHRDYQRYREYCARRLRRLRKGLDFKYSPPRGEFSFQHVTPEMAMANPRYLLIPLMNAERAWGYAMQLKDENQREGEDSRRRIHLVKRLTKAAFWSKNLKELCSQAADDSTSLEAEAYAAWMAGNMLLEKDEWQEAFLNFTLAKDIYEQLSHVGTPESIDLMKERVEEISPSLRYCSYNLSRESGPGADQEALKLLKTQGAGGVGNDLLQSKIRKVMEETRKTQSEAASQLKWKGTEVPVRSEKIRLKLLELRDQREELFKLIKEVRSTGVDTNGGGSLVDSEKVSPVDSAYMESLSVLDETSKIIKDEQARLLKSNAGSIVLSEKINAEFVAIVAYVKSVKLQILMERNALYAEEHSRHIVNDSAKPQDVVNLYDRVLQNVRDLLELFNIPMETDEEDAEWEPWHSEDMTFSFLKAKHKLYSGLRTYHISLWYANAGRWAESLALLEHGEKSLTEGQDVKVSNLPDSMKLDLDSLLSSGLAKIRSAKCLALAKSFLSRLQAKSDSMQEVNSSTQSQVICSLPPAVEPVPCHPVVFDLAYSDLRESIVARAGENASEGSVPATSPRPRAPSNQSSSQEIGKAQTPASSSWLSSAKGWFSGNK